MSIKTPKAEAPDSAVSKPNGLPTKANGIQINKSAGDSSSIDDQGRTLLTECEKDIRENLRATFIVGWRLEQIRNQRLYRATHSTFEAYCRKRWDFSKTHVNRHIQAHLCEKHLKAEEDIEVCVPTKESQVRYLDGLNPEQWVKVAAKVKETVGDKEASAGDFGVAREELFPKPKRETNTSKPSDAGNKPAEPKAVVPVFDTNLVSFAKLKEDAKRLYNIFTNPTAKQEGLNIISKFQKVFDQLADAQMKNTNSKEAV